ncbi:MAG TPA: demethoxyubiquinone hydroxylase family protein [Thermoanaerobaculia bacterium]|nr:demethoxyubiquinone hydroxylase family protein [Thermoanaerobaculia bacterium]
MTALNLSDDSRRKLIRQLQGAYSGELAAGHAYRGHWRSLRNEAQRARVRQIEAEEWHHRQLVGNLLRDLGARPNPVREVILWLIGKAIGLFCLVGGWFAPMYGAGRLELVNIIEYQDAAAYALRCGHEEMIDCLLTMAEVEWEHERFFRNMVTGHWMLRICPLWDEPQPKSAIRTRHEALENKPPAVA